MLKTFGVNGYVIAILILTFAMTGGTAVAFLVGGEDSWHAFHEACAMNQGTIAGPDDTICVVNGKAVLFR